MFHQFVIKPARQNLFQLLHLLIAPLFITVCDNPLSYLPANAKFTLKNVQTRFIDIDATPHGATGLGWRLRRVA